MKIVNKKGDRRSQSNIFWLLLAIVALVIGILMGNAGAIPALQEYWHNLERRLTLLAPANDLPVLSANIDFEAYNQILTDREDALIQGILLPGDSTYVPAEIQQIGETVPVWVRLLPGSAEHLGADDKWNFELLTRDDTTLMGLSHANLIDPANNNWLYEWAFLESMQREGLHTSNYQFVHLILNGDDKGIYVLQEEPNPVYQSREDGIGKVVVSYDSKPLLEAVSYFGGEGAAVADPVSNLASNDPRFLQVSEIEDPLVTENELLSDQAERAMGLLLDLQSGDLVASDVLNAQQYGRFLALVDLWGASDSLSPLNLRYAYDSVTDRLEPIAINANPLNNSYRVPMAAMYQDPQIQAAYAAAAAQYSDPVYLDSLRAAIEKDYSDLERSLIAEVDKDSLWDELKNRQEQLRLSLRPTQPVIAQLGSPALAQDAIIRVQVANALNLPLEILGFDIDGATFLDSNPDWIIEGEPNYELLEDRVILKPVSSEPARLRFVTFDLPLSEIIKQDKELDFLNEVEIQVATSVLGTEYTQLTPASPGIFDGG